MNTQPPNPIEFITQLVDLIEELTDEDDCWFDHHGCCQAHGLADPPCPHARAKALVATFRKGQENGHQLFMLLNTWNAARPTS